MLLPSDTPDKTKQTTIMNPTSDDFTCTYDTNHNGMPLSYTIKSREAGTFPYEVAIHIAKKLAYHMASNKGGVITQARKEKIYNDLFI